MNNTLDNDFVARDETVDDGNVALSSQNFMTPLPLENNPVSSVDTASQMMTPIPQDNAQLLQTPLSTSHTTELSSSSSSYNDNTDTNSTLIEDNVTLLPPLSLDNDIEEHKISELPFSYLETEQNLKFPTVSSDMVDEEKPLSSFQIIGKWLKQATDVQTYWNAVESMGENVAEYKWAYDQGDLGDFDASDFGKETLKAGVRGFTADNLNIIGNVLSAFGTNLENRNLGTGVMTAGVGLTVPEAGKMLKEIGSKFRSYAQYVSELPALAPMQDAYDNDPSWAKLANTIGQGSSQVLTMGALAKFIGAAPAYALFAGGGAAQVFNESYDKHQDIDTASTLALLSGGTTFAIDKIFNPLPQQISSNAKLTSKMIAQEALGAPLREAGTEVLQQLLAENLVRKVGIDDTQDLFEGLVESALGAIAGSSALMAADGSIYYARKTYEDARDRMLLKGVTDEEINLFKTNALQLLQSKPEAFSKVLSYSLNQTLKAMEEASQQAQAKQGNDLADAVSNPDDLKAFKKLYDEMYQRSLKATGDETKAQLAAGMLQANALALYDVDKSFSPQKILLNALPDVKQAAYRQFREKLEPNSSVLFQFAGLGAKKADYQKLQQAKKMEAEDYSPRLIWSRTGWYHGGDGKWRFEINDSQAKLKLDFNVNAEELPKRYWQSYIRKLEELVGQELLSLRSYEYDIFQHKTIIRELYNYLYVDFVDFLDKHYQRNMRAGINRNGYFTFEDLEQNFEDKIKANRSLVNSKVYSLAGGYHLESQNLAKRSAWNRMPTYLRNLTLKDLLINRKKLVPLNEDNEVATPLANENINSASLSDGNINETFEEVNHLNSSSETSDAVAVIHSSDFKKASQSDFNQTMYKLLNSYQGTSIFNPSLGKDVEIRKSSIKEYQNLDGGDDKKLLIPYLPLILGKAIFSEKQLPKDTQSEPNVRAYYHSYVPVQIDGELKNARIVVKEDNNGDLFWDLRLQQLSPKEIESDITQTTGEVISYDDYIARQRQRALELKKQSRPQWIKKTAVNDNMPKIDNFYTDEQMKIIRSALEEVKYMNFLEDIWTNEDDAQKNFKNLEAFLEHHHVSSPYMQEYAQRLDKEIAPKYFQRREALKRFNLKDDASFYRDLGQEKMYRMYLAGQGDYHKPYHNMSYRPDYYWEAHAPVLMTDKFFNQPRYRHLLLGQKEQIAQVLDHVYRAYRYYREAEFAEEAEKRDIQAANAYIKEHLQDGDESFRRYWLERQLLLDKKEFKLGDLLDHPELYKNYPDIQDVLVKFVELDSNEGYHFYHDRKAAQDVLEIDPNQFDYANLKDLLLRGVAFAIQMREHFDLSLTNAQRRNFMDRHVYLAKSEIASFINKELTSFLHKYLPGEKQKDFLIDREVPLPLLGVYQSAQKTDTSDNSSPSKSQHVTFKDVNFDLLYQKMEEKYGMNLLDPDERKIGDFAYSALQDLKDHINSEVILRARKSSGYTISAPFPWGGMTSQGNVDMRAMLRRQDYSDWQRSFSYWDERNLPPPTDRSRLSYADLEKWGSNFDRDLQFTPDAIKDIPDDEPALSTPKEKLDSSMETLAKGAYDMASRTIYLFEKADAETIVHETFHYLSQLFRDSNFNDKSVLLDAYQNQMNAYRNTVLTRYKVVENHGKYRLIHQFGEPFLPDITRVFDTPEEAVTDATEELFVQRYMNALQNDPSYQLNDEQLLYYFYSSWLDKISKALVKQNVQNGPAMNKLLKSAMKHIKIAAQALLFKFKSNP